MSDGRDDPALHSIRSRTLCGRCKAATFLVWDAEQTGRIGADREAVQRREERRGMTRVGLEPGASEVTFLVRCSFFKMHVPEPLRVRACEAFRQHDARRGPGS